MNLTLADGQLVITMLVQGIIAFLFLGGLWFIVDKFTRFNDYEQIASNNWSYLIQRYGMLIAVTLGVLASFNYSGRWSSIGMMALGCAWTTVTILFVYPIIERALGTTNSHEVYTDPTMVSITKAAAYFAVGKVVEGSLSGGSPDGATAIAATVAFTIAGVIMLPLLIFVHLRGLKRNHTRGALKRQASSELEGEAGKSKSILLEAREGNLKAGFELAGVLVALGFLLSNAIAGDFVGWVPGFASFGIMLGISWLLLYAYRALGDKLVFRHASVNGAQAQQSEGPAVFLALLLPIVALVVGKMAMAIAGILA